MPDTVSSGPEKAMDLEPAYKLFNLKRGISERRWSENLLAYPPDNLKTQSSSTSAPLPWKSCRVFESHFACLLDIVALLQHLHIESLVVFNIPVA